MPAIRVELELIDGSFTTRMLHAGQTVRQFNDAIAASDQNLAHMAGATGGVIANVSRADQTSRSFLSTLRDLAIVSGLVSVAFAKIGSIQSGWIGQIVRINAEFERLNFQMRSMSDASDPIKEAGDNVAYLRKSAVEMPFTLQTINHAFVKLKATGTDPLNGSLQALADGVAAFGGSDEAFERVILGVSQMAGKGVIQMEEMRQQLGEQMPTAMAVMARSMGVSMSRLIKDISTGMLGSREALQLFYSELERSYGGRARYMMQTFSGQLRETQTRLQTLAMTVGGFNEAGAYTQGGFMDTLRDQLRELNDILEGNVARVFAQDMGNALSSIVQGLRTGIETIIQFRAEIMSIGQVLAIAFAGRVALAGIGAMIDRTDKLRDAFRMLALEKAALDTKLAQGAIGNAGFAAGTIGIFMRGALAAIPVIGALTLVAVTVADAFDIFGTKVNTAWKELEKFGATSREQIDSLSGSFEKEQKEFDRLLKMRDDYARRSAEMALPGLYARSKGISREDAVKELRAAAEAEFDAEYEIAQKREQIEKRRGQLAQANIDVEKLERKRAIDGYIDDLNERLQVQQNVYVADQIAIQKRYDEEVDAARKAGKTIEKVEAERDEALRKRQVELHNWQIAQLQNLIAEQQAIIAYSTSEIQRENAKGVIDAINPLLLKAMKEREEAMARVAGTPLIPTAVDDNKKFEKGKLALERLNAEVKGLAAALTGANAEVVELQDVLANTQKYGHIETAGVQELIDKLIEAQAQKELLDELMEGKKKLENDIERNRMNLLEKEMELKEKALNRELTEGERIKLRMEAGFYAGFGPQSQTIRWLNAIISQFNSQGSAANQVGEVLRRNTFGEQTVMRIRTVTDELRTMAGVMTGIGIGAGQISFGGFRMGGDTFLPGGQIREFTGTLKELIAKVESRGDYNATLDNGRWTDGPKNLVAMTLNEIRDLQRQMLANPENRALYGNGQGSSALGKYQIVGSTLEDLMKKLGLTGQELFDEKMQERLADALIVGRQGQGLAGLRNEWAGLNKVSDEALRAAMNGGAGPRRDVLPVYQADTASADVMATIAKLQEDYVKSLDEQIAKEKQLQGDEKALARAKALEELKAKTKEAATDTDGLNKNYAALVKTIESGKLGSKDIGAAEYKELLAAAKELDKVEASIAEKKKTHRQIESAGERFKEREIELARQYEEAMERIADPNELKTSSAWRQLREDLQAYVNDVEAYYGKDTVQYEAAIARKEAMLRQHLQKDTAEYFAALSRKNADSKNVMLTESEQARQSMQRQLAELDARVEQARAAGMEEIQITQLVEAEKARIRAEYQNKVNPLGRMFREWADLQGNLMKQSTQWLDNLAGGITDLIMGTGDLKQVINSILRDMVNMGVKYMMSQMMGPKLSGGTSGGKNAGGKGAGLMSKMASGGKGKGLVPVAHTGWIVGRGMPRQVRAVNPAVFAGAPKFHTGGIIGRDEVPIVAKKGEGVFTPEQMEAMGGFGRSYSFQISAPVSVQGSAGTPDQNQDLAKQVAREMEATMRHVVADEMRKQTRPGNMMGR